MRKERESVFCEEGERENVFCDEVVGRERVSGASFSSCVFFWSVLFSLPLPSGAVRVYNIIQYRIRKLTSTPPLSPSLEYT